MCTSARQVYDDRCTTCVRRQLYGMCTPTGVRQTEYAACLHTVRPSTERQSSSERTQKARASSPLSMGGLSTGLSRMDVPWHRIACWGT
jgi:hypothetical protein